METENKFDWKLNAGEWWSLKYSKQWNGQYKIMDSNGMPNREFRKKKKTVR